MFKHKKQWLPFDDSEYNKQHGLKIFARPKGPQ